VLWRLKMWDLACATSLPDVGTAAFPLVGSYKGGADGNDSNIYVML